MEKEKFSYLTAHFSIVFFIYKLNFATRKRIQKRTGREIERAQKRERFINYYANVRLDFK